MISSWVARLLEILYLYTGSWGVAIILFTMLIRLITHPLNKKQMDSMQKMQRLSPQLKVLQEKYKNDKESLSRETMLLYKENKVSPVAGCLPLLVQIPIFILLFQVLNTLVSEEGFSASFLGIDLGGSVYSTIIEACNATTAGLTEEVIRNLAILKAVAPTNLGITNVGYAMLNNPEGLLNFNLYIANSILLVVIAFLTWYQQKLTSSGNPQMAMMNIIMPIFLTWICLSFPGGVLLYWGTTSLLSVVQQLHTSKQTKKEMDEKPTLYKDKPMGNR
ncbi:MAG: YidC/Oxa1 family membrane protein insertase [Synergistaceae bacterium]|nr:YidC/Oxa1 family membrane protein insertase [Synergistaceae bacterium]